MVAETTLITIALAAFGVAVASAIDAWRRQPQMSNVILLSVGLAGCAYVFETLVISPHLGRPASAFLRMTRMLTIYVLLPWLLLGRQSIEEDQFTLGVGPVTTSRVSAWAAGIGLYTIALAAFTIFPPKAPGFVFWTSEAGALDWMVTLPCICVMAAVTDVWTRGFVLLNLAPRIGTTQAIVVQNILWIVLHLYELELLATSMTWIGALLLAITLGILGDAIALHWGSVRPLMAGHIWLNVGWVAALFFLLT